MAISHGFDPNRVILPRMQGGATLFLSHVARSHLSSHSHRCDITEPNGSATETFALNQPLICPTLIECLAKPPGGGTH